MFGLKSFIVCCLLMCGQLVLAAPIHEAAKRGDVDELRRQLYIKNVDPDLAYKNTGHTPLHFALYHLYGPTAVETVEVLLKAGANPNATEKAHLDTTSLFLVAFQKGPYFEQIAKMFVEYDADFSIENNQGRAPIDVAKEHYPKKYKALLRAHPIHI